MKQTNPDWVHDLYQAHAGDLYRIARARLQDPDLAYDLTQEVFLVLLSKAEDAKDHPNPKGWLIQTLNYKLCHEFDRQTAKAQQETSADELDFLLEDQRGTDSLDELLPTQLTAREKRLLKLVYEDRLTYREISTLLHVPPATCGTWIHRAKQKCRHYLSRMEGGFPHGKTY